MSEYSSDAASDKGLRPNTVSLAGLTAQAIGTNGPELNASATTAVVFIFAGSASPFAYLLALIPGLLYGRTIGRFTKTIVSAGGMVELHFAAIEGLGASLAGEPLHARSREALLEGRRVRYLSPEDELIYLAAHAGHELGGIF